MKIIAGLILAAALIAPSAVLAQSTPSPKPDWSAMQGMMKQMDDAHKAARTKMLDALSPDHRAYLANVIGQLAVAANPDPEAAATQIDATLSASEKAAVLAVQTGLDSQMKSMHETMMAGMPKRPDGANMTYDTMPMHPRMAPDAGRLLLHVGEFGDMGMQRMMIMKHHPEAAEPSPTPSP